MSSPPNIPPPPLPQKKGDRERKTYIYIRSFYAKPSINAID